MKTYCFKLYKAKRNKKLHKVINIAGIIYNHCIALHKRYYRLFKKSLNIYKLQKHLTKLKNLARTGKSVGYDFGLKQFLTASDNEDIKAPLFFKQNANDIKKANRILSRKKRGSNHRRLAKIALARLHKKIANQRKDFQFKLANAICSEYALICIEDLNIKGMQKRWGRKISDYGFSEFIKILEYKAREIGSIVQKIDRYYPSSQICHVCGTKNPETKNLAVREWICAKCKTNHDRDRNAAINIWKVGASTFFGEI
ncbi:transposase, IS605 OrfB family [Megamonas hypermegale]|uniref:Transposase, IS605 OrfB family n=3 Tax=Megamonas TaxID=158846 RepID=A0A378NW50_9FIRM|nr:RNA-guided endonuclease TnpB family protein [Megamonas hypermegale]STY72147.1 transposase, IS605 OrfB family [Megamonas hypermegale]